MFHSLISFFFRGHLTKVLLGSKEGRELATRFKKGRAALLAMVGAEPMEVTLAKRAMMLAKQQGIFAIFKCLALDAVLLVIRL